MEKACSGWRPGLSQESWKSFFDTRSSKCSSPERRPRKIWSRIQPGEEEAMENLTRYIIRVSFSRERMTYVPD